MSTYTHSDKFRWSKLVFLFSLQHEISYIKGNQSFCCCWFSQMGTFPNHYLWNEVTASYIVNLAIFQFSHVEHYSTFTLRCPPNTKTTFLSFWLEGLAIIKCSYICCQKNAQFTENTQNLRNYQNPDHSKNFRTLCLKYSKYGNFRKNLRSIVCTPKSCVVNPSFWLETY